MKNSALLILIIFVLAGGAAFAQTTEFTYQGNLKHGSVPANGSYDFEFQLYDDAVVGLPASPVISRNGIAVSNGSFTVKLDFGAQVFPLYGVRYLQISVRQTGGGAFTILTPREAITTSPYSIKSIDSINAQNAVQLGGFSPDGFIQNTISPQASSNFNISGTGTANFLRSRGSADFAGSVGIGTTSPQQRLHVDGNEILSTGGDAGFKFRNRGSTSSADDWVWYSNGNIARLFRAGSGDLMTVKPDGNVGIGNANPVEKLSVNGKIQSTSGGFAFPDNSVQTTAVGTTYTNPQTTNVDIATNGTPASILHLDLPAGTYLLTATVEFRNNANIFGQNNSRTWFCRFFNDTNFDQAYIFTLAGADTPANILSTTVHGIVPLSAAGSVDLKCHGALGGGTQNFVVSERRRLTAVKIGDNVIVQ